jgi:general secretion pathway protein G
MFLDYDKFMSASRSGFTIVELLIVIVVIGILAALSIIAFNGVRARAVEASVSSDLVTNLKKIKRFQIENNRWPDGDGEIVNLGNNGYGLRMSRSADYVDHPLATSNSRFVSCYYNKDSSNGWPGPTNSEGMALAVTTSTGKVLVGTTESTAVKDITSVFVSEATAATNNIPCRSIGTSYNLYIGGINGLGTYVPGG